MWLQRVEAHILEQYVREGVSLTVADSMRRLPPVHRDYFDDFVFTATAVAVGESGWDRFSIACMQYLSLAGNELAAVPPLIPRAVAEVVADVLSRFERFRVGDDRVDGVRVNATQIGLGEELFAGLGGDRGDGPLAAGARAHGRMMSARIADGFVHPAIGAHLWSDTTAAPAPTPASAQETMVLERVRDLVVTWRARPDRRPDLEREIVTTAQKFGWSDVGAPVAAEETGGWYVEPPEGLVDDMDSPGASDDAGDAGDAKDHTDGGTGSETTPR